MGRINFSRYRLLTILALTVLPLFTLMRVVLMLRQWHELDHRILPLIKAIAIGEVFDFATLSFLLAPICLILLILPRSYLRSKAHQLGSFVLLNVILYVILFGVAGEWIFWSEFGNRYNFIAVDYLIYTNEVIQNIRESYPLGLILAALGVASLLLSVPFFRKMRLEMGPEPIRSRIIVPICLYVFLAAHYFFLQNTTAEFSDNNYLNEISKNGIYSLFAAYRNNSLDYKKFYTQLDSEKSLSRLHDLLQSRESSYKDSSPTGYERKINNPSPEQRYNVIYLTIESLSGSFLAAFGNQEGITPNLDALISKSAFFTNFYATGTRTVRGLEALSLSLPPTPGNSILRRPENTGLFTMGQIFRDRKYDVKFIYGGYGYFDNMNEYFSKNEFDIVDRGSLSKDEIHFANAWGVCDEDLFDRVIKEADHSFEEHKPFFSLVMSTSNHRPYTFPQKIDYRSGTTRQGAVKYTDYAIGEFLKKAETKPWFKNTIFVIVADHCASVAGKTSIPIGEFHIPLFIYAPGIVRPQIVSKLSSQIDVGPTVLGLLKFSYPTKFFGKDLFQNDPSRAFMGTYQRVALYEKDRLAVLSPPKRAEIFSVDPKDLSQHRILNPGPDDESVLNDAISYYQSANYLYSEHHYQYDVR